jgi:hypothetical protein
MVRQQVAEHVLLKMHVPVMRGPIGPCLPSHGRPEDGRGGCNDHAGCSTKVSCGTSSLPRVSRLNSSVRTNATATPTVAISIGIAKPCGWLAASASPLIDHCLQVDIRGSRWTRWSASGHLRAGRADSRSGHVGFPTIATELCVAEFRDVPIAEVGDTALIKYPV